MTVVHLVLEHRALPLPGLPPVGHHLVSVPRLDRREKPLRTELPQPHLAAATLRPGARIARREVRRHPLAIAEVEPVQPGIAGSHQLLPRTGIPVRRMDGVQHTAWRRGDRLSLPVARPIEIHRHRISLLGRIPASHHGPDEQHLGARSFRIDPAHAVRRGHAVDFARRPGLSHIRAVREQGHIPHTLFRARVELVGQYQFGASVPIDVPPVGVERARHAGCQHMPLPGRVFVPREFRRLFVDGHHVFPAVTREIDRQQLITQLQIGRDHVLAKTGQFPGLDSGAETQQRGPATSQPTESARPAKGDTAGSQCRRDFHGYRPPVDGWEHRNACIGPASSADVPGRGPGVVSQEACNHDANRAPARAEASGSLALYLPTAITSMVSVRPARPTPCTMTSEAAGGRSGSKAIGRTTSNPRLASASQTK